MRYLARHGESRVAKAVLIAVVPPLMVKTQTNSGGLRKQVFDDFQAQVARNRALRFCRGMARIEAIEKCRISYREYWLDLNPLT